MYAKVLQTRGIAMGVAALLAAGMAAAAENEVPSEKTRPGFVDAGHAYASDGVRGLGAWLNGFFSDEDYEAELNRSWLRVRLDSFSEQNEGTEYDAKARLHLKVPALTERLRFEVLSAGEAEEDTATADDRPDDLPSDLALDSITAALSWFFRNDETRSISARVGLDFDGYDPDPFIGLRYREQVELNENLDFRFVQRFRYFADKGLESKTVFGLDRALGGDVLVRGEIDGTWLEEQPNYFYGINFALYQPMDEKSAVEYQILNQFLTDPHRLETVTLRLRYRRKVWREWLVMEAAPQLSLPRVDNYEPVPGFLFRLEMTFGG